jgi:hypothetical protein
LSDKVAGDSTVRSEREPNAALRLNVADIAWCCGSGVDAVERCIVGLVAGMPPGKMGALLECLSWVGLVLIAVPSADPEIPRVEPIMACAVQESAERLAVLLRTASAAVRPAPGRSASVSAMARSLDEDIPLRTSEIRTSGRTGAAGP